MSNNGTLKLKSGLVPIELIPQNEQQETAVKELKIPISLETFKKLGTYYVAVVKQNCLKSIIIVPLVSIEYFNFYGKDFYFCKESDIVASSE